MPQMMPLLWLNLFFMFSLTFFLFLMLNYFMKSPIKTKFIINPTMKLNSTWKW
uniref:ATP synthase F0 subunit 8 n=1 Tax=Glyphocrangon regalis TaxID=1616678 RepID=UPI0023D80ACF|nr:ATP synthase F0 subunit 8 [Glyphocrangon regalis]WDD39091.1 ATP synthase F0 subunit 8 [Glyphocrangon regalis]